MPLEIEKKFLITDQSWRESVVSSSHIIQGYLNASGATVRVRIRDNSAFLTLKGKSSGFAREEFEYSIPLEDAEKIMDSMTLFVPVEKIRYIIPAENGLFWEIDEFLGANAPLFTAEIELPQPDTAFEIPQWLGEDVSEDKRFSNWALSKNPFSQWDKETL